MEYEIVIGDYISSIQSLKFLVLSDKITIEGCFIVKLPNSLLEQYIEMALEHEILHLLLHQMKCYKASKLLDNIAGELNYGV